MTEQKIELKTIEHLTDAISEVGLKNDIQAIGAWQPSENGLKALEGGGVSGVLTAKALPRRYDTPTIPDGVIEVDIGLIVRSDLDPTGVKWLAVVDAVQKKMQAWQKSYQQYSADLSVDGEFQPTGFQLQGGDVGLDQENKLWTFSQSFQLYGIITNT